MGIKKKEKIALGIFLFSQIMVRTLSNSSILFCHFEIHWKTFNAQGPDHRALDSCQLPVYHLKTLHRHC